MIGAMLLTVSTVLDTLPNTERFVARNLAGGADHLVVFLDGGAPDVRAFLEAHPHVSVVRTDASWWHGNRPAELNVRQRTNANVVKALLLACGWVDWLAHVDADECVLIDAGALAAVPTEVQNLRLRPLEAVSRESWGDADPTLFKRLLGKRDLTLLQVLGVLDRAHNGDLFHGHVDGKAVLRPRLDRWLTLHHTVDEDREQLEAHEADGLRMLHYESFSGEEFVRKWTAILTAGPMANFRPAREPTAIALQALIGKELDDDTARRYLGEIFRRTTLDDERTLAELGLLDEIDPLTHGHLPAPFPAGGVERLDALLAAVAPFPKDVFHPGESALGAETVLREAVARLGDPGASADLAAALAAGRGAGEQAADRTAHGPGVKAGRRFGRRS